MLDRPPSRADRQRWQQGNRWRAAMRGQDEQTNPALPRLRQFLSWLLRSLRCAPSPLARSFQATDVGCLRCELHDHAHRCALLFERLPTTPLSRGRNR